MTENEIAKIIVDIAYHIHVRLGPGLLESVYEAVLSHELKKREISFSRQQTIPLIYDDLIVEDAFRADLIIEDKVIIEIKSL
ncbi:MAG: GxxExxY protein, partial [Blastocatellia bacterium]|nr:GxxExxY protein [Blastocatellia bacterium]